VKKAPETAPLIKCAPRSAYDLSVRLDCDTLFVNFFQAEKNLHLLIRFPDGFIAGTTIAVTMDEAFEMVKCQIDAVRNPDNFQIGSHEYIGHIQQPMGTLYGLLFSDLEPLFKKYRRIIISPHLFWHYFPFHALYNKRQKVFLCDQVEIGYCPSASILHHCMTKNRTQRQKGIILARNNGHLAHVENEATLVAASFSSEGTVFSGKTASLDQIETAGNDFDIIHLACHGYFNHEQPFLSGIDIPVNQSGKERTYLLDLFHRTLNCNLVSISACDSGLNSYTAADELIGLSRGLFCAGAASVLLSLWKVADASTCYMMENFYWHYIQNRQTKTRALQLAMQAVRSKPEYAHPYFWAPFVVMGDWR
jgi:CHAT domain-containing protein